MVRLLAAFSVSLVLASGAAAQPATTAAVRRALEREQTALDACLTGASESLVLDVDLVVAADGTVPFATVVERTALPNERLSSCVQHALMALRFEPGVGAPARFSLERRGAHLVLRRERRPPPRTGS